MTSRQDQWDQHFIEQCRSISKMSHAKRRKVGAVLVRDNRIILTGYNGTVPGTSNDLEDWDKTKEEWITKSTVFHAEENIILFAAKKGIPVEGATLYCTYCPCIHCAKMIIGAGIKTVKYEIEKVSPGSGLELLDQTISIKRIDYLYQT